MTRILGWLRQHLQPPLVQALLTAGIAVAVAFSVPVTAAQSASILVFGGALATLLLTRQHLSELPAESVVGLVAATIGLAVKLGAPITAAQGDAVLSLASVVAFILLGHGVLRTLRAPQQGKALGRWEPGKTSLGNSVTVKITRHGAAGIHAHPSRALGRRHPKNAPALAAARFLRRVKLTVPAIVDHFAGATFGLYGNDRFGVCGPTSLANLVRLVSKGLTGTQVTPSQEDVFTLYRQSGNPNFNPNNPNTEDNGVDMQTMLEAALKHGIGDGKGGKIYPVAFAKLNVNSDTELEEAVATFGGVLWGVNLETAQQAQSEAKPRRWVYKKSSEWGGHAVMNGKYEPDTPAGLDAEVISWEEDIETADSFRGSPGNQLEEAWVVVFEWHLQNPAFLANVDLAALVAEYRSLTGKELPVPAPTPSPVPVPGVASEADAQLWAEVGTWAKGRHSSTTKKVAAALVAWAKSIGLS